MSLLSWLCGPCFAGPREVSDDVSQVKVRPTWDGRLEAVGSREERRVEATGGLPCLAFQPQQAVIVTEDCPDHWDPINLSAEVHRAHRV
jgi:hypothetical protein